jgi:hypothetical protein
LRRGPRRSSARTSWCSSRAMAGTG